MSSMKYSLIAAGLTALVSIPLLGAANFELRNPSKSKKIYYQLWAKDKGMPVIPLTRDWTALGSRKKVPIPFNEWITLGVAADAEGKNPKHYRFHFNPEKPNKTFYVQTDIKPDDKIDLETQALRSAFHKRRLEKKDVPTEHNISEEELEKAEVEEPLIEE